MQIIFAILTFLLTFAVVKKQNKINNQNIKSYGTEENLLAYRPLCKK